MYRQSHWTPGRSRTRSPSITPTLRILTVLRVLQCSLPSPLPSPPCSSRQPANQPGTTAQDPISTPTWRPPPPANPTKSKQGTSNLPSLPQRRRSDQQHVQPATDTVAYYTVSSHVTNPLLARQSSSAPVFSVISSAYYSVCVPLL